MTTRHSPSACPAPVALLPTRGSAQTLAFSMPIDSATSAGSTTQLRLLASAPTSELTVRLVELVGLLRLTCCPDPGRASGLLPVQRVVIRAELEGMGVAIGLPDGDRARVVGRNAGARVRGPQRSPEVQAFREMGPADGRDRRLGTGRRRSDPPGAAMPARLFVRPFGSRTLGRVARERG